MKKLMLSVGVAALIAVAGGTAQAVDQNIQINATVTSFCTVGASLTPADINQNIPTDTSGNVVDSNISVDIGEVICNGPTNVTLSSLKGGVFSATAAPGGFQNRINYAASIAAPVVASVNANGAAVAPIAGTTVPTGGATSTPAVTVVIDPTANPLPLVAATDYADTLTVAFVPL